MEATGDARPSNSRITEDEAPPKDKAGSTDDDTRIHWVDVFKFLGIWAIYIGHFGRAAGRVYPFVFIYHVPLFFFAAGFFSSHAEQSILNFIKKKTLQLMLPYVFFSVIAMVVFTLQNDWKLIQMQKAALTFVFGIRNQVYAGSLWFIPCLYIISIIHFLTLKLFKSQYISLAVASGAFIVSQTLLPNNPVVHPSWFMNADSALYYYLYFALGSILLPQLERKFNSSIGRLLEAALIIFSFVITIISFLNGGGWLYGRFASHFPAISAVTLIPAVLSALLALIIIYFNVFLAKLLVNILLLRELGRETLIFCGTENVLKTVLAQLLDMVGLTLNLATPLITVVYSLICLIVSKYTLVRFFNEHFPKVVGKIYST